MFLKGNTLIICLKNNLLMRNNIKICLNYNREDKMGKISLKLNKRFLSFIEIRIDVKSQKKWYINFNQINLDVLDSNLLEIIYLQHALKKKLQTLKFLILKMVKKLWHIKDIVKLFILWIPTLMIQKIKKIF